MGDHPLSERAELDELRATVAELGRQLEEQSALLARLTAVPSRPDAPSEPSVERADRGGAGSSALVSRRGLIAGATGAAVAGAAAMVATAAPAAANGQGQAMLLGDAHNGATAPTILTTALAAGATLELQNNSGGASSYGLQVTNGGGSGISGSCNDANGIYGYSATGTGVRGQASGASGIGVKAGVVGDSPVLGVAGVSGQGTGVHGIAVGISSFNSIAGVIGDSTSAYGTAGFSNSSAGVRAASGTGEGIRATSTSSVGGSFSGGRAAINLVPKSGAGRPTTGAHSRGDLVVDSAGSMYLCITAGTPGKWVKFTVTAA